MKGLIYNTLYGFPDKQNLFSCFNLGFIFVIMLLFSQPNSTAVLMFCYICSFSLGTGSRLQSEKLIGWEKYELTLPLKKSQIIRAKYVSYLIMLVKNTAGVSLLYLLLSLFNGKASFEYTVLALLFAVAVALLLGSFIHPLYLMQKNADSSELLINSIFGALIVIFIIRIILLARDASTPLISYPTAMFSLCASVVLFILSYFLSVSYYKNKQR